LKQINDAPYKQGEEMFRKDEIEELKIKKIKMSTSKLHIG